MYIGIKLATLSEIHLKLKVPILVPKFQKAVMVLAQFFLRDSSHVSTFQNLTTGLILVILSSFVAVRERERPAFRVRTFL